MNTRLPLVASAVLVAALAGCQGHGNYTTEKISAAKEKMDMMKSGTEWEMARQSFLSGDLDKALKGVDRSIALNPQVPKSHLLRGRIMFEKGDMEAALLSLDKAAALDPAFAEAPYYTGLVFERMSQKERAHEQYAKAAEIETANAQYALAAAEMLIDLGRLDDAKAYLEARAQTFEHNAAMRQVLGNVAILQDRDADAVTLFNEARLLAPDDTSIVEDLARAQIRTRQFGDAEQHLARLLATADAKDRRDLKHLRASCLLELDRRLEARQLLIELTEGQDGQNDTEAWIALGKLCFAMNDNNRTREAARRVIAIAPDRSEGYILRALHLRRTGDLNAAVDNLNKALERQASAEVYTLLGVIQTDLNRTADARESFRRALELDPANSAAASMVAGVPESN